MKKLTVLASAVTILLASCGGGDSKTEKSTSDSSSTTTTSTTTTTGTDETSATRKYDVKSGIVHFETTIKAGGMNIVKKKILYFDDYGIKEAEEELADDGSVEKTLMSDGKNLIMLLPPAKESYPQGAAVQGTALRYDREAAERSGKATKVDNINVAGKDCDAYEYKDANTNTSNIFAGYKHITLYMKQTGAMNSETKATKFEEDAAVPAEKFSVPADYTTKKM